jgi:hypothetical protein
MPIIGWIRDLFGIQKDMYETKKTRLEIEKIEDEKREKLITPATIEDVKEYDQKFRRLRDIIRGTDGQLKVADWWKAALILLLCLLIIDRLIDIVNRWLMD